MNSDNPSSTLRELDVRIIVPREKHPRIHAALHALRVGEALMLLNDHDPRPLRFELDADHPGEFAWTYRENGPEIWRVEIARIK